MESIKHKMDTMVKEKDAAIAKGNFEKYEMYKKLLI